MFSINNFLYVRRFKEILCYVSDDKDFFREKSRKVISLFLKFVRNDTILQEINYLIFYD